MKTEYSHISEWERKIIKELTQVGSSNKAIAKLLRRSGSTIGRELERNCGLIGVWIAFCWLVARVALCYSCAFETKKAG